ncbi:MAG TPA: hypothetical protein PKB04_03555, partial [Phenylobacterium sp.]|nr:hypothetical protein [Phenylobacterium sp.]
AAPGPLFLRLREGAPAGPRLLAWDADRLAAGFPPEHARVTDNPLPRTRVLFLGAAPLGGPAPARTLRLHNPGPAPLRVLAVQDAAGAAQTNLLYAPVRPEHAPPFTLGPGATADFRLAARTDVPGLHAGRVQVLSDDPARPFLALNLAAAVASPACLKCAGDNDHWVPAGFTCAGRPDRTRRAVDAHVEEPRRARA